MRSILLLLLSLIPFMHAMSGLSLEEEIKSCMEQKNCIGISVVVVKENRIVYNNCFGYNPNYADSTDRRPICKGDIYWIASISKTFVATAIMQLVEEKKLSLDDDVNRYLDFKVQNPYFPNIPITVKMLLSHRSSLNDQQYEYSFNKVNPERNPEYRLLYNRYLPGADYDYCNMGYNILGAIIEKVSGIRFDDYIRSRIIAPLGLGGDFNVSKLDKNRLVWTYIYNKEKKTFVKDRTLYTYYEDKMNDYVLGYTTPVFSPAGGMKISAEDLARYMMMHMNDGKYNSKRIIKKRSERMMREIQTPEKHYALSLRHYNNDGYTVIKDVELIGQTGGSHGIHSSMIFNPKEKYGFIVICNGCTSKYPDGADLSNKIINVCYQHFIKSGIKK